MKYRLILLGLISFSLFSCEKLPDNKDTDSSEVVFNQILAEEYGADDYGMKQYVMAFLKTGPNQDFSETEINEMQAAHMENIGKMADNGDLILAGPFTGDSILRGIYIFDVPTIEEAKILTESDPAIKAGSLEMELIQWYGSAALMAVPQLHEEIAKITF